MLDHSTERHPIEVLAEDFVARYRRGEEPCIAEYTADHPALAEQIRTIFPAVISLEEVKRSQLSEAEGVAAAAAARMPEQVGDCRIVREVGRGGMGVVYEAVQASLDRRVAVKALTGPARLAPKQVPRFLHEAQAMARLHHTNIVPVFEVGEHEGLPFYVMQFIDGRGLDDVIAEWKAQSDSSPTNADATVRRLQFREAVGMVLQAAEALAYAHAQGTLHRDIKPSNLLLDARGTVWVTDFGLAKTTDQKDLTEPGQMAGTLRYMSPERFNARSDARSDVYSLGLTLYELLTLRPGFDETNHSRLIRQVTLEEPPTPRKCAPLIPLDLETVVLKAMARDPADRYQTAAEFADDLRRFLQDRPVRARRVGPASQLLRWCGRNPAVATLSMTALSLLIIVAVVASVAYAQTRAAFDREVILRAEAEEQRVRAETNLEKVQAAVAKASEKQLEAVVQRREAVKQQKRAESNLKLALAAFEEIFAQSTHREVTQSPDTGTEEEDNQAPGRMVVSPDVALVLQNLLKFYDQFGERNRSEPRLQREIVKAYQRVGDIQQRLGQFAKAETAYRHVLSLYEESPSSLPPTVNKARETAAILNDLGNVLQMTGRLSEAEKAHRAALETLTAQTTMPAARYELARTHNILGNLLWKTERADDSEQNHQKALALLADLLKDDPTNPDYRFEEALSHRSLESILSRKGKRDDALVAQRKAIAILESLVTSLPNVPDYRYELSEVLMRAYSVSWGSLASGVRSGRASDVEKQLRRAADLAKELEIAYPAVPQYRSLRGRTLHRLGVFLQADKRINEGESFFRKAVPVHRSLVEQFPSVPAYQRYHAEACYSLGASLTLRNVLLSEASTLLNEAIEAQQKYLTSTPENRSGRRTLSFQYQTLAEVLKKQGDETQAAEATRQAEKYRKPR